MLNTRRSEDRGRGEHGWLSSRHSFSFAGYYDAKFMGHRSLRVINEDHVAPGKGFGEHGHRDMEIISYVVSGALEHKDSLGTSSVIRPGEVQRMSAGRGVRHSEYNASKEQPVHFLQIWLEPNENGLPPSYAQQDFAAEAKGKLRLVASPSGRDGSLVIHSDAEVFVAKLEAGESAEHSLQSGYSYIQVVRGVLTVEDSGTTVTLQAGDGASLSEAQRVRLVATEDAEVLLFDLQ
ncbi:MAG: pirin family protein [Polyangiales bacterium]